MLSKKHIGVNVIHANYSKKEIMKIQFVMNISDKFNLRDN